MPNIVKLLIASGLAAVLAGCVVAPAPLVVAPPVVVVHGWYGGYWHR